MRTHRSDLIPSGAPRLALGTMRLLAAHPDPASLAAFLAGAADLGIAVLDSADIYGAGAVEPALGAAFRHQPGLRERFRLVTKCGIRLTSMGASVKHYDTSAAHVRRQVEGSLRSLGAERLDLLLIHRPDPLLDAAELADTAADLLRKGQIRAFGVSNFTPAQVDLLQAHGTFLLAANQVEASLWHPAPLWDGTLDQAQRLGLCAMAWSPLGGGRPAAPALDQALASAAADLGGTPAQAALAWLARHPARMVPVVGTARLERLKAAVAALALPLDRETWFGLLEAATGHPVP